MTRRFRPNRFEAFALVSVAVTTILFFPGALTTARLYARLNTISPAAEALACFGWLVATFGPLAMSLWLWRWSQHRRWGWIAHVLLFPLAIGLFQRGDRWMLSAVGERDWDGVIGGPILQAAALLILAVTGYYAAVLHATLRARRGEASESG